MTQFPPLNTSSDAAIDFLNSSVSDGDDLDTEDPVGRGQSRAASLPEFRARTRRMPRSYQKPTSGQPRAIIPNLTPGARCIP